MEIPVKTSPKYFYIGLLTIMQHFPPFNNNLPKKELEVLAEIMYQNYRFRHIDQQRRHITVFSTQNRGEMGKNVKLSRGVLYDYFRRLRKKGFLTRDNKLIPFFNIIPNKQYDFDITFFIQDDGEGN